MPDTPPPQYAPALLSEGLGWVWRRVGRFGAVPSPRLHLIPALILAKGRTACGMRLRDAEVRLPLFDEPRTYCRKCTYRNGGVAP